jgi:uncharacterized membrane protein YphA (DoxX/SURF4 family)
MKTKRIIFWISTGLIFITQGLMPIFTTNMEETVQAFAHLGYPHYFVTMLAIFKLIGGLVLIIPKIPSRLKEWAYACFTIDFIAASVSITVVDGFSATTFIPLITLLVLMISYWAYHAMHNKI